MDIFIFFLKTFKFEFNVLYLFLIYIIMLKQSLVNAVPILSRRDVQSDKNKLKLNETKALVERCHLKTHEPKLKLHN